MKLLIHNSADHPFLAEMLRWLADTSASLMFAEVIFHTQKYIILKKLGYEVANGSKLTSLVGSQRVDMTLSGNLHVEPQWKMIQSAWATIADSLRVEHTLQMRLYEIGHARSRGPIFSGGIGQPMELSICTSSYCTRSD